MDLWVNPKATFYRGENWSLGRLNTGPGWGAALKLRRGWFQRPRSSLPHTHSFINLNCDVITLHCSASVLWLFVWIFPNPISTLPSIQGAGLGPGLGLFHLCLLHLAQSICLADEWMREWMMIPGCGSGQTKLGTAQEGHLQPPRSRGAAGVRPCWAQAWGLNLSKFLPRAAECPSYYHYYYYKCMLYIVSGRLYILYNFGRLYI